MARIRYDLPPIETIEKLQNPSTRNLTNDKSIWVMPDNNAYDFMLVFSMPPETGTIPVLRTGVALFQEITGGELSAAW
jgi:hypothetical protein